MALVWTLVRFLFCLFVVEAFPKFPRCEYGYVAYRLPPRCVPPPRRNTICNLDYDITSYARMAYGNMTRSIDKTYKLIITSGVYGKRQRECAAAVKRLFCKSSFPACLDEGRLDHGDKKQLFADVANECPKWFNATNMFSNMQSGIHKDPHTLGITCVDAQQDPQNVCPKPKYKLPSDHVKHYYAQVAKVMSELDQNKDTIPDECYEKAKNAFACSYPFCPPDGNKRYLLMKTTKQQCERVRDCLSDHGMLDKDTKEFMDENCPKYPDEDTAEQVEIDCPKVD